MTNVLVPVVSCSVVTKPSTARAVEHHGQRKTHLWVLGSHSLCSLWKCGSPAEPTLFEHLANERELEFKKLKGEVKCKKCYDSNIGDTFLQQGSKNIKLSENESSALTQLGPDFSFGVCPSSSSSTSYDSEPVKEH